jgi:sulfur-oxidizing protein SoxY
MNEAANNLVNDSRRALLTTAAGVAAWIALRPVTTFAQSNDLAAALRAYTGGATTKEGRVKLDIAELVDNGNAVPVTVTVDSPMTATNHVTAIALFNEKNPQRDIARFQLGPRSGKAIVSTRIRLATTQRLVAVAKMNDGSFWTHNVDVIVTLAACIED